MDTVLSRDPAGLEHFSFRILLLSQAKLRKPVHSQDEGNIS